MIDDIEKSIINAKKYNIPELQTTSVQNAKLEGLFLEFGVWTGDSIKHLSNSTNNIFYGFDSFEGLPEDWGSWGKKGTFKLDENPKIENEKIKLVVGLFEDTIDDFMKEHTEIISFIHIDCDLYSSTKTIFEKMEKRFVKGTIILFDEIINYPISKEHEIKAFSEFLEKTGFGYECIGNSFNDRKNEAAAFILT